MSTDIKPGQVWDYTTTDGSSALHEVRLVTESHVKIRYQDDPFGETTLRREYFLKGRHLVKPADATPAPLDPSKVKAGDTVTVRLTDYELGTYEMFGTVRAKIGGALMVGPVCIASNGTWRKAATLTAHQPAPEPEPEWKPGTVYSARYYMKADSEPMWFRDWKGAPRFVTANGEDFPPDEVEDVRPLVVIDPATVDVDALNTVALKAYMDDSSVMTADGVRAAVGAVLAKLGIEAP